MDSSHVLLKKPIHSNSGFRFDPNKFKGGDEETTTSMQTYLVEKCREQGFYLRPTINCKRTKRGKRLATLDFVCDHNAAPVQSTPSVAKSKKLILPKSSFFFFLKYQPQDFLIICFSSVQISHLEQYALPLKQISRSQMTCIIGETYYRREILGGFSHEHCRDKRRDKGCNNQ